LADDEILTHRGQTLSEIEKFDDPRSDEEEEEETGKLGGECSDSYIFPCGVGGVKVLYWNRKINAVQRN
jgi:nucleolar protein 14